MPAPAPFAPPASDETPDLAATLRAEGRTPGAVAAALALDGTMARWRRRAMQRRSERHALDALGLDLDVPRLDVLTAILAPHGAFDCRGQDEPTVGTIAQRLGIDPSRASRLIGDLIASGHVRRAVSQQDARRTVVVLTDAGRAAAEAVRATKIGLLAAFLEDWTEAEIETFLPLLERFSRWTESFDPDEAPPAAQD